MPATPALPSILIVTPYLAAANNGNWRTADRWARLLRGAGHEVIVQADANGADTAKADCMIALHARRSHPSVVAWRQRRGRQPLVVAMTGTDLYRDLPGGDGDAADSIEAADALIVLQPDALTFVPPVHRRKAHVVFQSARALRPCEKPSSRLNCIMVGHLRPEKDPRTAFEAWRRIPPQEPVYLRHAGSPLDPDLAAAATALMQADRRYRWLGPVPHPAARQAIKRAHLLLVPSLMEGGANVVVEAITSGTAVLGSRMSGNVGMLGADYSGLFTVGSSDELAALLLRCRREPGFLRRLEVHCAARAGHFSPAAEQQALSNMLQRLL